MLCPHQITHDTYSGTSTYASPNLRTANNNVTCMSVGPGRGEKYILGGTNATNLTMQQEVRDSADICCSNCSNFQLMPLTA